MASSNQRSTAAQPPSARRESRDFSPIALFPKPFLVRFWTTVETVAPLPAFNVLVRFPCRPRRTTPRRRFRRRTHTKGTPRPRIPCSLPLPSRRLGGSPHNPIRCQTRRGSNTESRRIRSSADPQPKGTRCRPPAPNLGNRSYPQPLRPRASRQTAGASSGETARTGLVPAGSARAARPTRRAAGSRGTRFTTLSRLRAPAAARVRPASARAAFASLNRTGAATFACSTAATALA
jgi:hypothetical protein